MKNHNIHNTRLFSILYTFKTLFFLHPQNFEFYYIFVNFHIFYTNKVKRKFFLSITPVFLSYLRSVIH
jgi:hypothetical protein